LNVTGLYYWPICYCHRSSVGRAAHS